MTIKERTYQNMLKSLGKDGLAELPGNPEEREKWIARLRGDGMKVFPRKNKIYGNWWVYCHKEIHHGKS